MLPNEQAVTIRFQSYRAVGNHQQNTSLSSAQPITVPEQANALLLQATSQNVRFRLDEGIPTTSVGFQLRSGDPAVIIPLSAQRVIRFIEEAASAKLDYQFLVIS